MALHCHMWSIRNMYQTAVYNCDGHHACQSQVHPWRLLLPSIWQQRILRQSISHGKEVGLPWSTREITKGYGVPDSMIYDGAQEQAGPGKKSKPTWENTASMGIHQKGNVPTKTQKKALFGNCTRNSIEKCLEHTVQDDCGATDTHTLPRLCNWWPDMLGDRRDKIHLS